MNIVSIHKTLTKGSQFFSDPLTKTKEDPKIEVVDL